jgi:hypothetical protein
MGANVVAVVRHVERRHWDSNLSDGAQGGRELFSDGHTTALDTNNAQLFESLIALDDFVGHPLHGPRHGVGSQQLALNNKSQAALAVLAFFVLRHISPVVRASQDSLHDSPLRGPN